MVARISVGKNLYGALAYNQNKVDEGGAKVLRHISSVIPKTGVSVRMNP